MSFELSSNEMVRENDWNRLGYRILRYKNEEVLVKGIGIPNFETSILIPLSYALKRDKELLWIYDVGNKNKNIAKEILEGVKRDLELSKKQKLDCETWILQGVENSKRIIGCILAEFVRNRKGNADEGVKKDELSEGVGNLEGSELEDRIWEVVVKHRDRVLDSLHVSSYVEIDYFARLEEGSANKGIW